MKNYKWTLLMILFIAGCSKTGDTPNLPNNPPPIDNPPGPDDIQITGISPAFGYTDDAVQISGKNFGTDKSALVVKFNGIATALLMPNTPMSGVDFTVKIPAKCGTGIITITKAGKTATGPSFFYLPSATVTTLYGKYNAYGDDNGSGINMRFAQPEDFVFDKNNNIYVTDDGRVSTSSRHSIVRKISATGTISTYSGGPLDGTASNDKTTWSVGLPDGSGGNSDVNGGMARFEFTQGICISEEANSNAFKLFIGDHSFIRIINEFTATGVYAGVIKDSVGGTVSPQEGERHEAHLIPLTYGGIIKVSNNSGYGSPDLYFLDHGSRIAKIDGNGHVSTFTDLTFSPGIFLARNPDGNFFMHSNVNKIYKVSSAGILSTWINSKDSLMNKASGLNECFQTQIEENGNAQAMCIDKNGHVFVVASNGARENFIEIFPDKSFIRRNVWAHVQAATDGFKGNIPGVRKIIFKDNGDMYVMDYSSIRKITYE